MSEATSLFPDGFFRRDDERPDRLFYNFPRYVTHIDEPALAALTDLYRELLPQHGVFLDLMSSWVSHLPPELPCTVYGLGLNPDELAANPRLNDHTLHDLNETPELPFPPDQFDAAMCVASVDYLTRPLDVFAEVNRVLKPGGVFVVSFSNRCFPTKAIRGWLTMEESQRVALVAAYFMLSGGWGQVYTRLRVIPGEDPMYMLWSLKQGDLLGDEPGDEPGEPD